MNTFAFHWLIILLAIGLFWGLPLFWAYRIGKKVGDSQGYMRGFKEAHDNWPPEKLKPL